MARRGGERPLESAASAQPPREPYEVALTYLGKPSYHHRVHSMRRVLALTRGPAGYEEESLDLQVKLVAYEFAQRHGVRLPHLYGYAPSALDIDWDAMPERFVLKGNTGTSAQAVFLLEAAGSGRYRDMLAGELVTPHAIADRMQGLLSAGRVRGVDMFVEELLTDAAGDPAPDWKLFCFHGTVGMVYARSTHGSRAPKDWTYRYFDRQWRDLGAANMERVVDPLLPLPEHADDLVATAERLSAAIPRPYVSIDLYDTAAGVVFGEVTLSPGGRAMLTPDLDRRLGALWEDAEARLAARAGRLGASQVGLVDTGTAVRALLPQPSGAVRGSDAGPG